MHLCIHYFVQQIALVIKSMETGGVECIKIEWVSASHNRLSDSDIHWGRKTLEENMLREENQKFDLEYRVWGICSEW